MARITGTHIYGMLRCPHAVALDLHEDRSKRRPITEIEEFVRKRGRDWEDEFVAELDGYVEPEYERGEWGVAAAQTEAFLREGVAGVSQGVLVGENRLGIPDLLRREPGECEFGDFHYVVGDIKSSGRPRSDQLLQVAFYSGMLGTLQGRVPEYGYLILKDGREERFALRDYQAAFEEVEERVLALAADSSGSEAFFGPSCRKCHWSELCVPQMEAASDVSLVPGMTRGLRTTLKRIGVEDVDALRSLAVESAARRTHLEPALLRRLKMSAEARKSGQPIRQQPGSQAEFGEVAVLHHLYDAYSERMLFFGVQFPATEDGEFFGVCPSDRDAERDDFVRVVEHVPENMRLLHYGEALPRWFADCRVAEDRVGLEKRIESRFVDLARRLRGAAIYPGPVFGMAQHVEYALGLDPHREGEADAAAMWGQGDEGEGWLMNKGRSDLADLCALAAFVRESQSREAKPPESEATESESRTRGEGST